MTPTPESGSDVPPVEGLRGIQKSPIGEKGSLGSSAQKAPSQLYLSHRECALPPHCLAPQKAGATRSLRRTEDPSGQYGRAQISAGFPAPSLAGEAEGAIRRDFDKRM